MKYLVSGTYYPNGSFSEPQNFQIEDEFESSRAAFLGVSKQLKGRGYSNIHVVAIKMACSNCGESHIMVSRSLYAD